MKRNLIAAVAALLIGAGLVWADFPNEVKTRLVESPIIRARTIEALPGETLTVTAPTIALGNLNGAVPTTQVIGAAGTIAADACGGLKRISSAAAVTTSTTNTFTAPAAANAGCVLNVCNENATDAVTLDNNALFQSAGAADVVLGALDCVQVASSGASGKWYQISALVAN